MKRYCYLLFWLVISINCSYKAKSPNFILSEMLEWNQSDLNTFDRLITNKGYVFNEKKSTLIEGEAGINEAGIDYNYKYPRSLNSKENYVYNLSKVIGKFRNFSSIVFFTDNKNLYDKLLEEVQKTYNFIKLEDRGCIARTYGGGNILISFCSRVTERNEDLYFCFVRDK